MVPATFRLLDAFPLTPNGKVERRALAILGTTHPALSTAYPPRLEPSARNSSRRSGSACSECHGSASDDNFFELGGHSMLATQLVSRIRDTLGLELPVRVLFEAPTVSDLARAIAQLEGEGRLETDAPIPRLDRMTGQGDLGDIDGLSDSEVDAMLTEVIASLDERAMAPKSARNAAETDRRRDG